MAFPKAAAFDFLRHASEQQRLAHAYLICGPQGSGKRTLAAELAPRAIRVNTIHPGPVDNEFQRRVEEAATGADRAAARTIFDEMIPLGRHATAEEIAQVVVFLASDESSFITGATIAADGGLSV